MVNPFKPTQKQVQYHSPPTKLKLKQEALSIEDMDTAMSVVTYILAEASGQPH